jgi:lantibiotic modifying enzyme
VPTLIHLPSPKVTFFDNHSLKIAHTAPPYSAHNNRVFGSCRQMRCTNRLNRQFSNIYALRHGQKCKSNTTNKRLWLIITHTNSRPDSLKKNHCHGCAFEKRINLPHENCQPVIPIVFKETSYFAGRPSYYVYSIKYSGTSIPRSRRASRMTCFTSSSP